jgi:molecular chaperone DnaK
MAQGCELFSYHLSSLPTCSSQCSQVELLTVPLIQCTVEPCKKVLADAGVKASGINEIILVGGMMMPHVVETVEAVSVISRVSPDEAIAIQVGAPIQGGVLAGNVPNILLLDVTPLSLGMSSLLLASLAIWPQPLPSQ